MTQTEITKKSGKNRSVISREMKRNSDLRNYNYSAYLANNKVQRRHKSKPKKKYWDINIEQYVNVQLSKGYSPEQIAGRAKVDNVKCVSHERIYQCI